jgi:putative transposase
VIYYAVYLVFEGLSFEKCSKTIKPFIDRTPKAIWDWYQELGSDKSISKIFRLGRERVKTFAIDETEIVIDGTKAYFLLAYEPFEKRILGLYLTWEPNSIVVEMFLKELKRMYGKHTVWTDGAEYYSLACQSVGWKHYTYGKGSWLWEVMERAVQYLKDRTEAFDDHFPCKSHGLNCHLKHVWNWINLFFLHHQPNYQLYIDSIMEELRG